jgi:Domain of unknown function (DUF4276)
MTRVNFIVEWHTEEDFVNRVLIPYLSIHGVYASARRVQTSRHGNKIYRGGLLNYKQAKNDILRWLSHDRNAFVTTMFDLYALPEDFPGIELAQSTTDIYERVAAIENALSADINQDKFLPYIQLHEFEALLFSGPEVVDEWMGLFGQSGRKGSLDAILGSVKSPEHIDQGRQTAPSKRLKSIYAAYDKVFIGSGACQEIGIQKMRNSCEHFSSWIGKILGLAN